MLQYQLLQEIRDVDIYNYYREHGRLNIHAEYGYLVSAATAAVVSSWWKTYCE